MPRLRGHARPLQAKEGPMPQLVKKRRSRWAVLVVTALVASLFAVGASPAAAVDKDSRANYTPSFSACVGPALSQIVGSPTWAPSTRPCR